MAVHQTPLIGRATEMSLLAGTLDAARENRPSIAIVSGEAGIGKTRLVEEFAEHATNIGFLVAFGRSAPVISTRLPYGPVVGLIGDVLRQCPDLALSVAPEVWRGVAPLTGSAPEGPTIADLNLASTRLFAGFAEVVAVESRRRPLLLVVEDMHWADPATIDALAFAARQLRGNAIVLVLTNRPAGAPRRSPVRSALGELRRLDITVDLQLGPLPDSAVQELLDDLPVPPDPQRRQRIADLAEGIPFFALHLASHRDDGSVPARLRDVLLNAIDELPAAERALLILLTVMGDPDNGRLLAEAGGASADDFHRHVRSLMERGLLVVKGGAIGFRHALLREVMVEDTLPTERVVAHGRAAQAMLSSDAGRRADRAAQLAHHLLECGRLTDAIGYAVRGARQAGQVWAYADAQNLYAAVRRLWPLVESPEAAAGVGYAELLREAAMASRWCGDFDEALDLLGEALRQPGLDRGLCAAIEHSHGQVLWATNDVGGSIDAFRRAESLLPPAADDRLRAAVLAALAQGLMASGQARQAETTAHAAAELAGDIGAHRAQVHASITEAAARAQQGDVDFAVDRLRWCLPWAHRLDDLELVLRCHGNLTFALGLACRYEELATAAADGVQDCRRYGPVLSLASSLMHNRVNALIDLGHWDEAVAVALEALRERTTHQVALHLRLALAEVAINRGDNKGADRHLELARELTADDPHARAALSVVVAEQALWHEDPGTAATSIASAVPVLEAQDVPLPQLEACWLGLRAAADLAHSTIPLRRAAPVPAGSERYLGLARSAGARTDLPVAAALLLTCEAEASRSTGSDTAEQWTGAAAANAELHRPFFHAYCMLRLARVQLRGQARSAASRTLTDSLRTARSLDARPLAAEIATLSSVSGLRLDVEPESAAAGPARSPSDGLTPRERQVLALLTTGATNRVIGRTLFISERTASVHVSNILGKLGAANRTEAARLALRYDLDAGRAHLPDSSDGQLHSVSDP
jgi:DNA-binding CsgD family transcriptional regulator/tetratricopeptide (TPR) repeat protein